MADDLQVVDVAPSFRAVKRLRRLEACARGRPRLAIRRMAAAAAAAAAIASQEAPGEVLSDTEAPQKRARVRMSPSVSNKIPRTSVNMARLECAKMAAILAEEKRQSQRLKAEFEAERRSKRVLQERSEHQLDVERGKNDRLKAKITNLEWRESGLQRENDDLKKRVRELFGQYNSSRQRNIPPSSQPATPLSQQNLFKQIAEMECRVLSNKSAPEKIAFKKKLLIKWHPDKQLSSESATLATGVMQEMQNVKEWPP